MCGRYVARWTAQQFEQTFNVQPLLFESYNVAPTQPVLAVPANASGQRELTALRWRRIASW